MNRQVELAAKEFGKRVAKNISQAALARARATCPVQTGDLLSSLYATSTDTEAEVGSPLPYAKDVEEGYPAINVSGTYVSKIKRHKRRTKYGGKTTVRAHTKTFQNMKPVLISGDQQGEDTEGVGESTRGHQQWRTLSSSPGREGTHFLKNAMRDSIAQVLGSDVATIMLNSLNATGFKAKLG